MAQLESGRGGDASVRGATCRARHLEGVACSTPGGVLGSAVRGTDARAFPGALGGRELPDAGGGRMRPSCRSSWHSGGRCVGACHRTGLSGRVGSRLSSFTPAVGGCGQAAGAAGTQAGAVWAPVIARTFPGALGVDVAPLRRRWADAAGCMSSWHSGGRLTGACPRRGTSRAAPRGRRACRLGCGGPALQFMVGMVASAGASLRAAGP